MKLSVRIFLFGKPLSWINAMEQMFDKPKTLYIIGNGFDLYHGLPTRYSDFEQYLKIKNSVLHDRVEQFLFGLDEHWWNFEEALANLDTDQILDEASNFLVSYGADDWSDSYHHDYQYEINQITSDLSSRLKQEFWEWISGVNLSDHKCSGILELKNNTVFLNFNYTRTLEDIYQVTANQILHIHGAVDEDIVLGHDWKPERNQRQYNEDDDTRVIEGHELIQDYFRDTFKSTATLIEQNQIFFDSLNKLENIYVWGHSLSDVDLPYFEEIVRQTSLSQPEWRISYFSEEEFRSCCNTMTAIGVSANKQNFHKLVELPVRGMQFDE